MNRVFEEAVARGFLAHKNVPLLVNRGEKSERRPDFTRAQLVLMGHTDGVGSAAYNRELSHRRAQSVARFLSEAADIPIYRIKTSGMGFDYLKTPYDPKSAVNRRVQVLLVE